MTTWTLEEFYAHGQVQFVSPTGCLLWGLSRISTGYGSVWDRDERRLKTAHRMAWEIAHPGETIPNRMVVCHSCDVKACVNADHLSVGSYSRNTVEAIERGLWRPGEHQRSRTHCPQGHEYSPENTWRRANGYRICKTCANTLTRKRRAS